MRTPEGLVDADRALRSAAAKIEYVCEVLDHFEILDHVGDASKHAVARLINAIAVLSTMAEDIEAIRESNNDEPI